MTLEELLTRIGDTITTFNIDREKLTDEAIRDLRMGLSSDLYFLIDLGYVPAANWSTSCYLELEKTESETWDQEFRGAIKEGYSNSQSTSLAGKRMKAKEPYLEASKNYKDSRTNLDRIDRIMRMGQQVLNSMSKRINH